MGRKEKILVVEDNPDIREQMQQQFNCDCASDGWEAIEKLESGDYAAILIDADVPQQSGYGVLTYLSEEVGGELPNVIFMTSNDCEKIRRRVGRRLTIVDKTQAADEVTKVLGA